MFFQSEKYCNYGNISFSGDEKPVKLIFLVGAFLVKKARLFQCLVFFFFSSDHRPHRVGTNHRVGTFYYTLRYICRKSGVYHQV